MSHCLLDPPRVEIPESDRIQPLHETLERESRGWQSNPPTALLPRQLYGKRRNPCGSERDGRDLVLPEPEARGFHKPAGRIARHEIAHVRVLSARQSCAKELSFLVYDRLRRIQVEWCNGVHKDSRELQPIRRF